MPAGIFTNAPAAVAVRAQILTRLGMVPRPCCGVARRERIRFDFVSGCLRSHLEGGPVSWRFLFSFACYADAWTRVGVGAHFEQQASIARRNANTNSGAFLRPRPSEPVAHCILTHSGGASPSARMAPKPGDPWSGGGGGDGSEKLAPELPSSGEEAGAPSTPVGMRCALLRFLTARGLGLACSSGAGAARSRSPCGSSSGAAPARRRGGDLGDCPE